MKRRLFPCAVSSFLPVAASPQHPFSPIIGLLAVLLLSALLQLNSSAQATISVDPNFSLLGTPGATIWLAPQVQDPNV